MKKLGLALVAITSLFTAGLSAAPASATTPNCTIHVTTSNTTVNGTGNGDVICIDADNVTVNALGGNDTVIDNGTGNTVYLGDGNDTYDGSQDDSLSAVADDNTIYGDDGDDTIIGGSGIDTINGGNGNDTLNGNAGADQISGMADDDTIDGGSGNDMIDGGDGNDTIIGGNGDDTMRGGLGDDALEGDAGRDNIFGESGADRLEGDEGDDVLAGGPAVDQIAELDSYGLNLCDYTTTEVHVQTCIYDDTAPTVDDFAWNKASYEVGLDDATANVTITASDDQGVGYIWLYCYGNDTNTWPINIYMNSDRTGVWTISGYGDPAKVSQVGNSKSVKLTVKVTIPYGTKPGTYQCTMQIRDLLEHYAYVNAAQLAITRTNGTFDDDAPALSDFSWDQSSYEVGSAAARPIATFKLTDTTGASSFWGQCYGNNTTSSPVTLSGWWDSNNRTWVVAGGETLVVNSSSNTSATLAVQTTVRQGFKPASYNCYLYANDIKNHSKNNPITNLDITRAPGTYDDDAPAVTDFSFDGAVYDSGPASVQVRSTLTVTDATGIGSFQVYCQDNSPNPNPISYMVYGSGSNWYVYGTGSPFIYSKTGDGQSLTLTVESTLGFGSHPGTLPCYVYTRDTLDQYNTIQVHDITIARTPPGMPNAPTGLAFSTVDGKPNEGNLTWTAPSFLGDPNLKDYQIQYSTNNGTDWKTLYKPEGKTTDTSYHIAKGLVAGTDYWFRVRGENGGGLLEGSLGSAWSNVVQARTLDPAVPLAPTGIAATNVTKNSAALSWVAPTFNGGALITNFVIETSRDEGTTWTRLTDEQKPVNTSVTYNMNGLASGVHYLVRVAALNRAGLSEYNTLTAGFTTTASAASKPRNLVASQLAATTLTLGWDIPDANGGNPISDYRVEVSGNGGTTWTAVPHTAFRTLGFNVNNLTKGKSYKFRVAAVTSLGIGAYSDILTATTLVSVPSAPTALVLKGLTTNSVGLAWTPPTDQGGSPIYDYQVQLSRDGGDTWTTVDHPQSISKSYAIRGLVPGSTYQVSVSAINAAGYSELLLGSFTTLSVAPTVPLELSVSNVTLNTLRLDWATPENNGGSNITDYKIEVSSNCKTYTAIAHTASNQIAFGVEKLSAGTKYCFRVSAKNSVGYSVATAPLEVTTIGNAPAAPTALRVTAKTKTTIGLGWSSAAVTDGSKVRDYLITYSTDQGSTWTTVRKLASPATSYTVSGLRSATTYWFKVVAVNDVGASQAQENPLVVVTK